MSEPVPRVARWAELVTFTLSLVGLGLSGYLTITHFAPQALVCTDSGLINCAKVTSSPQSVVFGVPVAILGLANYSLMAALNSPWGWRSGWRFLHVTRFALSVFAMGFVLWLVYAELLVIGNICLYCTAVHVTTFALLVVLTVVAPAQLGWTATPSSESAAQTH